MNESDEKLRQLIAENIAYYRKLNGDTQAGLAEKLSYSDKSVSKWERGDAGVPQPGGQCPRQPERGGKLRRQVPFCQIAPSPQHWDSSPPVPGSNPSKKVCLSEFPHCIFPKT